jgi:hypothetical protein
MTTTITDPKRTMTRTFDYYVALDNHYPMERSWHRGTAQVWEDANDPDYLVYVLGPDLPFFDKAIKGVFLVDDGNTVEPFYVAAWHPEKKDVILHRFPVNPDNRVDSRGRVIDFSTWNLGPRLAFHLKVLS